MAIFLIVILSTIFVVDVVIFKGLLFEWGTLNSDKILSNQEWWRVTTSSLLHWNIIHILANSIAIYFTGVLIESKIGSIWFLLVFLISNILERIIFVYTFSPSTSVGSSPGIFALMGVILIYFVRNKDYYKKYKKSKEVLFLIHLTIGGSIIFVTGVRSFISGLWVHGVGFLFGILFGLILLPVLDFISDHKVSRNSSM